MKKVVIIVCYLIQMIMIGISFIIFSSTIKFMPWYEPLSMGAFFANIVLMLIQAIFAFIFWEFKYILQLDKNIIVLANINSAILVVTPVITVMFSQIYYIMSIVLSVIELFLVFYLIAIIVKKVVKYINMKGL